MEGGWVEVADEYNQYGGIYMSPITCVLNVYGLSA